MSKKFAVFLFSTLLTVSLLFPLTIKAHEGRDSDDQTQTNDNKDRSSQSNENEQANEDESNDLNDNNTSNTIHKFKEKAEDLRVKKEEFEVHKQDRQQKLEELRTAKVSKKCETITERVNDLMTGYGNLHLKQSTRYLAIQTNLERARQRLSSLGIDTSELELKLQELNTLVVEYISLQDQFESTLENSSTVACAENESEFTTIITNARQLMKDMKAKAKEIQAFWKDQIKPLLAEYKLEAKKLRPISSPE